MGDKNSTRSRNDNQNRASRRKDRPQIILFTENVRGLKRDEDLEAALASVGQRGGSANMHRLKALRRRFRDEC